MNASGLVVRTWNDAPISRRDSDGFADATAMCQANGKRWPDYIRLDTASAYIQALSASLGIPADQLVITTTTGPNHLRGTWVHPRLAVDLARWLSPQFAVWMDGWFLEQLEQGRQQQAPGLHSLPPYLLALPVARPGNRKWRHPLRPVGSFADLGPCEQVLMRAIHFRREINAGCRTRDLEQMLAARWSQGTVRNMITRLRDRHMIIKRGHGWHLTTRGAALADHDATQQWEIDQKCLESAGMTF